MPTYQYQCTQCGEGLEVQQSFTDDSLTVCPTCEGRLRKVFNAVGVVFKGSGFYHNDSRAANTTSLPAGKTESHSESAATAKPEKKAESTKSPAPSPAV